MRVLQEMTWRKACLTLHLWLGLGLGALTAVIGLSGSAMIFGPELEARFHPQAWRAHSHYTGAQMIGVQTVADTLQQLHPESKLQFIRTPRDKEGVYEAWLDGGALRVNVEPYSGRVLSSHAATQSVLGWMYYLHTELFSGGSGHVVVGYTGLALLVLSLSGIVLWWPRKSDWRNLRRWRAALAWSSRAVRRPGYNLHRFIGWIVSLLLCVIAISGVALVFPEITTRFLEANFGAVKASKTVSRAQKEGPDVSLDFAVEAAQKALPGARVMRVSPAAKPIAPIVVRLRFPEEIHPYGQSNVYLDRHSGQVLRADDARAAPRSTQLMNLRYPLHLGRWGGDLSRVLHFFVGFSPAILYVTGLMMWRNRWRKRRHARQYRAASH